ncbi:MAG: DUF305 domain-containing protein [Chloroflexi bacterium]|nr:DUF305 domain-containing protein [Chloroflexota bacterium]
MKKFQWMIGCLVLVLLSVGVTSVLADGSVPGRAGRAEVRFLEGMMDHHQMALDMANDCLAKATDDAVRALCQNILSAQSAEIQQMHDWLLGWYNVDYSPVPMSSMTSMTEMMPTAESTDMQMSMGSMSMTDPTMMMGMMAGLSRAQGKDYDVAFLESMIDHHDDAVHMSQRLLERDPEGTGHAELRTFAQKIIDDQSAEIQTMETLLTQLGD